jgi:hypothetical protein
VKKLFIIIGIIAILAIGLISIAASSPSDSSIITKLNNILTELDAIATQITNSVSNIVYELDLIDMHVGDVQTSLNTTDTVVDSIQSSVGSDLQGAVGDLQGAVGDLQDAVNSKVTMEPYKSDEIIIPYTQSWDSPSENYTEVRHVSLTLFYTGMTADGHDHDIDIKTYTEMGWEYIAQWSNLLGDPFAGTKIIQFDTDNWYIDVFNSGAESQVDMHIVYYFTSTYVPAEAP